MDVCLSGKRLFAFYVKISNAGTNVYLYSKFNVLITCLLFHVAWQGTRSINPCCNRNILGKNQYHGWCACRPLRHLISSHDINNISWIIILFKTKRLQTPAPWQSFFFFSTQLYFTIFTFLFVTTRQSSTYQQSITDFKVRTLVCIRTFVTSDNTYTPNNAPKATGNGLIQYGTVITRSILLNFSQEITHSLPVRARNGCLLWVSSLIYALLLSVQCCVYIRDKLDRVITAPDLTTQTSTVYIWQTILGDIIHNKTPDKWSMGY